MKKSSLFEKEGPIAIDDLKANFKKNDFTTMKSKFNPKKASEGELFLYGRAKTIFQQSWNDKMGELTGLSSLLNFSECFSISGRTAERLTTQLSGARLPRSTAIPPVVL